MKNDQPFLFVAESIVGTIQKSLQNYLYTSILSLRRGLRPR